MADLSIDIETRSSVEIRKAGLYRYAQSPDFEVLLFAYQMDDAPVKIVDLAQGEKIPEWIVEALQSAGVIKHAYNAAFEWYCLNRAGYRTPLAQWRCTMRTAFTADIREVWMPLEKQSDFHRTGRSLPQERH